MLIWLRVAAPSLSAYYLASIVAVSPWRNLHRWQHSSEAKMTMGRLTHKKGKEMLHCPPFLDKNSNLGATWRFRLLHSVTLQHHVCIFLITQQRITVTICYFSCDTKSSKPVNTYARRRSPRVRRQRRHHQHKVQALQQFLRNHKNPVMRSLLLGYSS